ncbi:5-guanidino-2-oxopentanoate decarboxylase [Streptomyces tubercidicus]|uniref:5-guanidino-2-oxopentanoate decarboxylase n=1 Tax=Streptomyces tubercidicus TaxID=47759 RepID=UPI00369EB4C8
MTRTPTVGQRSRTGSQLVIDRLVAHGVDTVFGIPGTHSLALYESLAASHITHVTPRHEQGAGYAADGYARISGRAGVVLTTSGPGLLNAAAAAGQAYSDSVPLLFISPGMPLGHRPGAGLLHEAKDQSAAMAAICGWSRRVTEPEEITAVLDEAFAGFASGRPRPVHLEIPWDLLDAPAATVSAPLSASRPPVPSRDDVAEAAGALARARRPVVIAGGGARGAAAAVTAIAELLGAAVVTTVNGKGVLSEYHPLSLGTGLHLEAVRSALAEADTVLAVGTELSAADTWDAPLPLPGVVLRVDIDPEQLHRNARADHTVAGPASAALELIWTALLEAKVGGERLPGEHVARWKAATVAEATAAGAPWARLITALREVLPAKTVLVNDSAGVCYHGATAGFPVERPGSFLYPTGFGTLGYALPAAIGAKTARPDRPVVALSGDGGMQFTVNELATAAELGMPLPVLVVENGGYGEIRKQMLHRGASPLGTDVRGPDFAALARAYGGVGVHAGSAQEAAEQVLAGLRSPGPTVVVIKESSC